MSAPESVAGASAFTRFWPLPCEYRARAGTGARTSACAYAQCSLSVGQLLLAAGLQRGFRQLNFVVFSYAAGFLALAPLNALTHLALELPGAAAPRGRRQLTGSFSGPARSFVPSQHNTATL